MALNTTALASMLQDRESGYLDVISRQIPLFDFLRKKGNYVSKRGGQSYEWNVDYALDEQEPSYAGFDTLPVRASDTVQTAQANWKSYYKPIAIAGDEHDFNKGEQIFDLLEQKEENALSSMRNQMNTHFYQDGTANASKRITGLKAIIDTSPTTGTLFNIDRSAAANAFWRNQKKDTNDGAFQTTPETFTMRADMDNLYNSCGKQNQMGVRRFPDLIICTQGYWELYSRGVDRRGQRFTNTMSADAGFDSLEFRGATLIWDEDMPADAGSDDQAYFLNSDVLKLLYIGHANFKVSDPVLAEEQDAFSKRLIWRGQLISTNPQKLGLHEGVKAFEAS